MANLNNLRRSDIHFLNSGEHYYYYNIGRDYEEYSGTIIESGKLYLTLPSGEMQLFSEDGKTFRPLNDEDFFEYLKKKYNIKEKEDDDNSPPPTGADPAPPEAISALKKALAVCLTPDVCKTPCGSSSISNPYQVYAEACNDENFSSNVLFNGNPAMRINSVITKTLGDAPGTDLGEKSITVGDIVEAKSGSLVLMVNDHPAIRHQDSCTLNSGNTIGEFVFCKNNDLIAPPEEAYKPITSDNEDDGVKLNTYNNEKLFGQKNETTYINGKKTNSSKSFDPQTTSKRPDVSLGVWKDFSTNAKEVSFYNVGDKNLGSSSHFTAPGASGGFGLGFSRKDGESIWGLGSNLNINMGQHVVEAHYNGVVKANGQLTTSMPFAEGNVTLGLVSGKDGARLTAEAKGGLIAIQVEGKAEVGKAFLYGWGPFISCTAKANAGIGGEIGGEVGSLSNGKYGVQFNLSGTLGVGAGLKCSLGVFNE